LTHQFLWLYWIWGNSFCIIWIKRGTPFRGSATRKIIRLWLPISLGLALNALLVLNVGWQSGRVAAARAANPTLISSPQNTIRYVAATGFDAGTCTDPGNPCCTLQNAADQATASTR
jgi:hypothetical protein